jgi:hypothetical protein
MNRLWIVDGALSTEPHRISLSNEARDRIVEVWNGLEDGVYLTQDDVADMQRDLEKADEECAYQAERADEEKSRADQAQNELDRLRANAAAE